MHSKDVAIIGMSCVFPKASDLKTYWQNIVSKVDAIVDPPEDWGGDRVYDPDSSENDRIYCKRGGFLGDLSCFDPVQFGIMPVAVDGAEPEHFMALKVAQEALKDAGFPGKPMNQEGTEVILGRGSFVNRGYITQFQHGFVVDQTLRLLRELHPEYTDTEISKLKKHLKEGLPPFNAETAPGMVPSVMSGLIANRLNLRGPNFVVDAACASGLIALEIGVRDLLSHRCDMLLVGGVQVSTPSLIYMLFTQLGALSHHTHLRPFDRGADGTMLGEGVGMLVMKRREDAEKDGHRIYSLIKGIGSSSDGRAKSVLAPRVEGEELALRRAYDATGISPDTVGLIEAHGTSIPLGDVTEVKALRRVFGSRRGTLPTCALGSVKSMIGHLIPAAGIAGVIKASLALYHKILPPTLHCSDPNPELRIEESPFYLNTETRPWVQGKTTPRRAGINAFGFGGINAHVILEEPPLHASSPMHLHHLWDTELFVFAGLNRRELIDKLELVGDILKEDPHIQLKDLAFTLNTDLQGKTSLLSIVASSAQELQKRIDRALKHLFDSSCQRIHDRSGIYFFETPSLREGKIAFIFPGEGSQYRNMLNDLCIHFPEVRSCFDAAASLVDGNGGPFSMRDCIFPPPTSLGKETDEELEAFLGKMEGGVPAVTVANWAMSKLLELLDIFPQGVVGHSSGEFAALQAAGVIRLDSEEALEHYLQGGRESLVGVAHDAAQLPAVDLVAVSSEEKGLVERVLSESRNEVVISMDNCPHQRVLCGTEGVIRRVVEKLRGHGATCLPLPFSRPYHTSLFSGACDALKRYFSTLQIASPVIPVYSCATAEPFPKEPKEIRSLAVSQWYRPVRFQKTVEAMYAEGFRVFLEVGPKSNLTSFVNDILRGRPGLAIPTNIPQRTGICQLQHALGILAAQGLAINFHPLYQRRNPRQISLSEVTLQKSTKKEPYLSRALPELHIDPEKLAGYLPSPRKEASVHPLPTGTEEDVFKTLPLADVMEDEHFASVFSVGEMIQGGETIQKKSYNGRSRVLDAYWSSMEDFLHSQETVMQSFLSRRNRPLSDGRKRSPGHDVAFQRRPFVHQEPRRVSDRELVMKRKLDPAEDLFLQHHTMGGKVSRKDPTLLALPVMPLTMSMEILGEVAAEFFPSAVLVGMKNVRAHRWLIFDQGEVEVQVTANRCGDDTVETVMCISGDESRPIIEGTMIFAPEYPQAPSSATFSLHQERPSRFRKVQLYRHGMFSGPAFQAIDSIKQWGTDGSIATFRVPPREGLFRFEKNPDFVTDPVILDAAGQQVGHWNAEESSWGFNIFPYKLDELRLYGPPLSQSDEVTSRLRVRPLSETLFRSDIDMINAEGNLWAQMIGWEDKLFDLPDTFYDMLFEVREMPLGRTLEVPAINLAGGEMSSVVLVDKFSESLLLSHGQIWLNVLAFLILSRREREEWLRMEAADRRRMEWLLGRAAAKDAVRRLLRKSKGLTLCPAEIEITSDRRGRPLIGRTDGGIGSPSLHISIAHSHGIAVAIVAEGDHLAGVGIDLEANRKLEQGFVDTAFNRKEQELLSSMQESRSEWVLRFWCAKEALGKSLGIGLLSHLHEIEVMEFSPSNGMLLLELKGDALQGLTGCIENRFQVATILEHNHVVATIYCRRSNSK